MSTSVAVFGARGRLGSLVCEVVESHPAFVLGAQLGRAAGEDAGSDEVVVVDVSHPDASPGIVERALRRGQRVLVGTSGWSAERLAWLESLVQQLRATGGSPAVIVVPNFSLGSVIGTELARIAAPYFDSVEIVEAHHEAKVDSPSGTAVRTAELVSAARAAHVEGSAPEGRPLDAPFADQRARGELIAGVPVHSLRLRGVIAKQEVRFGGTGEVLT
ncbi:MAG: 4-hydroxy-tetrahydrodipicolinate reductase, partial [Actinobacteria bacterium]|nr:4-hydroxy-tetrahydrodipicolinate reductase [Actinomycetota bacterium]